MKIEDIINLQNKALNEIEAAADSETLEAVRIKYIGRKGLIPDLMKGLKGADPTDRPEMGKRVNELKNTFQEKFSERRNQIESSRTESGDKTFDVTLPGQWRGLGKKHPISYLMERAIDIFHALGFTVADGPDIETVFNNFDALNHPPGHPARDATDTFYLSDGDLLRTHTSPVQVRHMLKHSPPVRIIAPGRCYRRDTPDATHSANFHQIEGLYVAENVSLADLKGDLAHFAHEAMGPETKVRFRPHFFPFTEPSVEVDFSCHICRGDGCRVCKQSGWIEIAGAGMVDPGVFEAVGYDTGTVTGYAFGMGIERIAMILFGITDIRDLYENDIRYLRQF